VRARDREHGDVLSERVCVVFVYRRVRGCVRACACVNTELPEDLLLTVKC